MMTGTPPKLEEVFKTSGVPTYTFVEPKRYSEILLSLRTPGRCLVVEGPSGIGKSTAIESALSVVQLSHGITKLTARQVEDVKYIEMLPSMDRVGIVIVDDFHRLSNATRSTLADYLKVLADREDRETKIVVLGINRAGDSLINFAPDLVNRIDIVRFETEPDNKIRDLIQKGADALNINMVLIDEIVESVSGSFYLTQMLCREICLASRILEAPKERVTIDESIEAVKAGVWDRLGLTFRRRCEDFCRGSKLRPEGRAPYLHILNWLATGQSWTLDLREAIRRQRALRGSVMQVVDRGYLKDVVSSNEHIQAVLHYDEQSNLLTVEDPQFLFYIRNIPWRQFARDLGFLAVEFERRYDFALSFAGSDRDVAEKLFVRLTENEVEVFYDRNEQHRMLALDLEEYLRPIYQTEAQFVIVLLGHDYPKRIWTKFESESFKERFVEGSVIPIWFADVEIGMFDESRAKAGLSFDRSKPTNAQIEEMVSLLIKKLGEAR